MQSTLTFTIIYVVGNISVAIAFLYLWGKNFRATGQFMHIGLSFVAIILASEVIALSMVGLEAIQQSLGVILFADVWTALRIYVFTVVGLLLVRRLEDARLEAGTFDASMNERPYYGVVAPSRESVTFTLLAIIFMIVFSAALFHLTDVKISKALQAMEGFTLEVTTLGIVVVAIMGFGEEIIFRLGLQNGLTYLMRSSRFGHYWAVLGTTALWCLGHVGTLEPNWVKFAQIFVFGLVLGNLNRRFGIIPCIMTHVLFNISMALLTPTVLANVFG